MMNLGTAFTLPVVVDDDIRYFYGSEFPIGLLSYNHNANLLEILDAACTVNLPHRHARNGSFCVKPPAQTLAGDGKHVSADRTLTEHAAGAKVSSHVELSA